MIFRNLFFFFALMLTASAQESNTPMHLSEKTSIHKKRTNSDQIIRVGVRSAARPFSYKTDSLPPRGLTPKSGPLRSEGYDGYIVYICDEVLKQMLIPEHDTPHLNSEEVSVEDIDVLLQNQIGEDRLSLLGTKIDILCDPATIEKERVRQFAVSPPLFATGIGFLQREAQLNSSPCTPDKALIGAVGTTNAVKYGISAILASEEWNNVRDQIELALRGEPPCSSKNGEVNGIIWIGATHQEVASRFCAGDIFYYVGDLEIIAQHARRIAGCDFIATTQSFTNDRYGIYAAIDYSNEWKALRLGRFFEVLNREITTSDSLLDRAYLAEFGERTRSPKLEMFYWSIRGTP